MSSSVERKPLTSEEISAIVDGFDSIDWVQVKLIANLPPGKRIIPMLQATEMVRAGLRAAFTKKFPELSRSEINMKILEYMTDMDKRYGYI
ncbi:MAG: hypothetical protein FJZ86_18620 [Chloroflexi bacterium]|nr:hypothetical protein [Chloroflexota bacterium]